MALLNETCDFAATTAKARKMTDAALAYTIKDCFEAAQAGEELVNAGFSANPGKYWDEYFTYCQEQRRRHDIGNKIGHRR